MKRFVCSCGASLSFESSHCAQCETDVGFNPEQLLLVPLSQQAGWAYCDNHLLGVCNWLRSSSNGNTLCVGCQFNRVIPRLTLPQNLSRWAALERAKKRLLYTLMVLELPLNNGWQSSTGGLLFDFLDDERSQPKAYPGTFVTSGYANGVITLNVLEADDVARTAAQVELRERYRTLLGHFRHESGHYFWSLLDKSTHLYADFACYFGDEKVDYGKSMQVYYEQGPTADWRSNFISAYASSHPLEDWAESWSQYLLIEDGLDTAFHQGWRSDNPRDWSMSQRIDEWTTISAALNEMSRSLGQSEAYPFSINTSVRNKLDYVDRVVNYLRTAH